MLRHELSSRIREEFFSETLSHEKSWGCQTPRKSLVAGNLDLTRC